jgi:hypothetical protein
MLDDADFRGDCGRCAALCCLWLSFEPGELFGFDKAAGEACRHLRGQRCAIHARLARSGMRGCAAYDCLGAGQLATAMFAGLDAAAPSIRRAQERAFAQLRQIQALRLALHRAGLANGAAERRLAEATTSYAALLRLDLAASRKEAVSELGDRAPARAVALEQRGVEDPGQPVAMRLEPLP